MEVAGAFRVGNGPPDAGSVGVIHGRVSATLLDDLSSTAAVDPIRFREACVELCVWEDLDAIDRYDYLRKAFYPDGISATARFLDLAVCLIDGTLRNFTQPSEFGGVVIPNEVFEAAAVCPMNAEGDSLDRKEWFAEIARRRAISKTDPDAKGR